MGSCTKCGNQDTKFVSGIGKTSGKPYSGYKCECGNMDFVKSKTFSKPSGFESQVPQVTLNDVMKELKSIKALLGKTEITTDEAPF